MNVCFVVDNSVTTSHRAYNGLSLLEFAKNFVEKSTPVAPLGCHLFRTSIPVALSGYQHDQQHFFCQLKLIQQEVSTDITAAIKQAYYTLGRFRQMNHTENLMGFIEAFNLEPNVVVLLTDGTDLRALLQLQQTMKDNRLLIRPDSQLYVIRLCPPSRQERNPNFQQLKKLIERQRQSRLLAECCQYTGGFLRIVVKYQQGFQAMDQILNRAKQRLTMRIQLSEVNPYPNCFKESGIVVTVPARSFLKERQFLVRHTIATPERRLSRLPIPCRPPRCTNDIEEVELPELLVNFSRAFDSPMSRAMPFEKLQLEDCRVFFEVREKMRCEKLYFPVYHQSDQLILFGLLKLTRLTTSAELFFYVANFPQFSPLFSVLEQHEPWTRQHESQLSDYLKKVPGYYSPYITSIFRQRGYNRQINLRQNQRALILNEQLERMQHQLRKQLADGFKGNLKVHSEFTSECCPIYSQRYPEWSQSISKFRETSVFKRTVKSAMNSILKLKQQIFPDEDDDICLNEVQVKPVVKSITYSFTMEVNENQAYMGRPTFMREQDELTVFERPIQKPTPIKPPVVMEQPPQPSKNKQLPTLALQKQQLMVKSLCELFPKRKQVTVKFKGSHLSLERRQANLQLLDKTF